MVRTPGWPPSSPVTASTSSRATPRRRPVANPRREPVRTCVACRQEAGKRAMVRIVRSPEGGGATVDRSGGAAGRGAYLHADAACIEIARKRRALERSLKTTVGPEVWLELSV
ncbi:MAG TPA: YlxR family protein [Candidatus Dormibacteraeota bacterium]|nr:YlxR family protein [Candidatus Dormibacteraeota bacterium]